MKFLARIYITPKEGVNNPEGLAIKGGLETLGYTGVEKVNSGKYIEIELNGDLTESQSRDQIEEMCKRLLANIVIEQYRFELELID
ncbi:MAG: phosphoribosylformylglycinamidine synthase subunit PurS [Dehalococcoidia bacterium]